MKLNEKTINTILSKKEKLQIVEPLESSSSKNAVNDANIDYISDSKVIQPVCYDKLPLLSKSKVTTIFENNNSATLTNEQQLNKSVLKLPTTTHLKLPTAPPKTESSIEQCLPCSPFNPLDSDLESVDPIIRKRSHQATFTDEGVMELFDELQQPYSTSLEFINHLLILERYRRSRDLIMSHDPKKEKELTITNPKMLEQTLISNDASSDFAPHLPKYQLKNPFVLQTNDNNEQCNRTVNDPKKIESIIPKKKLIKVPKFFFNNSLLCNKTKLSNNNSCESSNNNKKVIQHSGNLINVTKSINTCIINTSAACTTSSESSAVSPSSASSSVSTKTTLSNTITTPANIVINTLATDTTSTVSDVVTTDIKFAGAAVAVSNFITITPPKYSVKNAISHSAITTSMVSATIANPTNTNTDITSINYPKVVKFMPGKSKALKRVFLGNKQLVIKNRILQLPYYL